MIECECEQGRVSGAATLLTSHASPFSVVGIVGAVGAVGVDHTPRSAFSYPR